MGEMIHKPDANPVLLAVLNLFVAGGLGYFLMGQKKKAIMTWVAWAVSWILLGWCGVGVLTGSIIQLVAAYDAYLLGQKLQRGESIGENENGLDFLNAVFKD